MENSGKRSFLKQAGLATLIGAVAAGFGANAFAQGGPGYGPGGGPGFGPGGGPGFGPHGRMGHGFMGGPFDPAQMDQRIERMAKHLAVEADATPEQTAKLADIAKSAAKELRPMRQKVQEARKRGMELLAAPTVDRGAIEKLRSEQIAAADAASKRLSQALADAAEVLTPEQRKKLAEHFQSRGGRHRGGPWMRG